MLTTLFATPLLTYGLTAVAGVLAYPVGHYFVTKINAGASAVSASVTSDVATLKADVAALKAKLP